MPRDSLRALSRARNLGKRWRLALAALLALYACSLQSCEKRDAVTAPVIAAPASTTPVNALHRLGWAVDLLDVDMVAGLLADDFHYVAAPADSAGDGAIDPVTDRAWLLAALRSMFEGQPGGDKRCAVRLTFGPELRALSDPRPGRSPEVHQTVRAPVTLVIDDPNLTARFEFTGHMVFYCVRADSAQLPPDVPGAVPAKDRWWIDRIDDETLPATFGRPADGTTAEPLTLRMLLDFYRQRSLTR